MKIYMTPRAYWHLHWMAQRTDNEISSMGILSHEKRGIAIREVVVVKQEASPAHVDLDMRWWADKQVELYEARGFEPWQTACWIHTHPEGVDRPSATDKETMRESFGACDFALMVILTKCGRFYARADFNHDFGPPPAGLRKRFRIECDIEVDWTEPDTRPIDAGTLREWDAELDALVRDPEPLFFAGRLGGGGKKEQKTDANGPDPFMEEEVNDYVEACIQTGVDPDDEDVFERYFGRKPTRNEVDQIQLEGGGIEWWYD